MTVRDLIKILADYDIQMIYHTRDNYNEEVENIDIWSKDFFNKE